MIASPQSVFHVEHAGWNEIGVQRSNAASLAVDDRPGGDVRQLGWTRSHAAIAGESPLRYFDKPPHVTIRAGNQVLATAEPSSDFELDVKVPASALAASDGMLTIETDQSFVPYERTGSPDRRTLGLRLFEMTIQ